MHAEDSQPSDNHDPQRSEESGCDSAHAEQQRCTHLTSNLEQPAGTMKAQHGSDACLDSSLRSPQLQPVPGVQLIFSDEDENDTGEDDAASLWATADAANISLRIAQGIAHQCNMLVIREACTTGCTVLTLAQQHPSWQ